MQQRQDYWFRPAAPHTDLAWQQSADGWLRLAVTLDGTTRSGRSSALDPDTAPARDWYDVTSVPPGGSGPEFFSDRIHRLNDMATQGVAANDNPHEDTRGLEAVPVEGLRYGLPPGFPATMGVSRSRDGILLDIPLSTPRGEDLHVMGLGEKTGSLDKRGRTWVMWNCDEPVHSPEKSALYQAHPVVYLWTPGGTVTLFIDTMATVWFDVGEAEPGRLLIEIYDNRFDCYLRTDESLPEAVESYSALTGRIPLPPEWALGFQQCRYSYFPEERVLEVAQRFREEKVPCDVLYLDIHYMDGYRVFTWDHRRFPEPDRMVQGLRDQGFRVVTIVDPGVKTDVDYPVFASGLEKKAFLTRPGGELYVGKVWPGDAAFPDFSRPATREWWARWHKTLFDAGVAGIWNDMNEPADFTGDEMLRVNFTVPDDLVAYNEGEPVSFGRVHNEYANGMNRATRDAFLQYRPEERGFVLTRSGGTGVQRYAAIWTGDNHSWWEHLAMMVPMFLNVGLSGAPFVGGDAGGFQLNADAELYRRWIAAAAFTPFFRAHSALDTRDHEPWSFGPEALETARRFIGIRYRIMPYLYTLFEEASRRGTPVMRPLLWEFPQDPRVASRADSFLLGEALLVAPVREPGVQERSVYLPAGVWYDFWSGERIDVPRQPDGSGTVVVGHAPLDRIPLYLRGGYILPHEGLRQHTGEAGDGVLRLLIAPDAEGRAQGTFYGDAGEGFGYCSGRFWRGTFSWDGTDLRAISGEGESGEDLRWTSLVTAVCSGASGELNPEESSLLDLSHRESPLPLPWN
ncbi:alpha-glucosidase [Alkalispirochaeta americana]|uniref:Alpha-glucosidase n=1 Tax=Alkalispirochaeta americana TaxID=159291 RepID=A0A1N6QG42_9SPIO|nr:TIM-barrel domain-containing protein [Alkalispirochaeta americana]SIQ15482.1 alpha-glucosidase [Alkalispirochaeta americana]